MSKMNYVPLRVYSVFSRGKGAVLPAELAGFLQERRIPYLAVTDPFGMFGWESYRKEAVNRDMKSLPGLEIRLQELGSLILFPQTLGGYFSLVPSFNAKLFSRMEDVITILIPGKGKHCNLTRVKQVIDQVPAPNLFIGLEWDTPRKVVEIAGKLNIPLVWAQPLRWIHRPDRYALVSSVFHHRPLSELFEQLESTDMKLCGPIGSAAIRKRWGDTGERAMKNTFQVASRIQFDFSSLSHTASSSWDTGPYLPSKQLMDRVKGEMKKRNLSKAEIGRTRRELSIIDRMGFSPYFLIAEEIARYCKNNKIYFNLRGSGGSSFVLYLLGLSRINPLKFNLLFERFVNSLRDDLPDIDIDFDSSRRHEVLEWVFKRYEKRVAFVSTHKFFRARSALYETARVSGFNPEDAHKMTKELPMFATPSDLKDKGKGRSARLYSRAALLEGVYKELSLHVGGVVFSPREIVGSFPVERSPQDFPQMAWDKNSIERLKIFKLDLLGVRGFDVISQAALNNSFDFSDPRVWDNIAGARTLGCFQLESPLSRENLARAKPQNLQELAVSVAIIRPGPARSGMKQAYIEKKKAMHPVLNEIFPYTRGALIFEEQISILLHTLTDWSLEKAEMVRRALKKKKGGDFMDEFFERGLNKGWPRRDLERFWKIAGDFSLYAFNHAHSLSYGYSAFISAWMKTTRPLDFFCRLLNSGGGYYPLLFYIEETKKWGIRMLPPDVNLSKEGFSCENGALRTGLMFIKGIGRKTTGKILEERGRGYQGMEDFIARTRVGERDLSALVSVSAFSSLGKDGLSLEEKRKNWRQYLGFCPE